MYLQASSPYKTMMSMESSGAAERIDNFTLRTELIKLGFKPGPIDGSTRELYLKKLQALKKSNRLPLQDEINVNSTYQPVPSLPSSAQIDNFTIRVELLKLGLNPGPVVDSTRTLYLKKLMALKKNPIVVSNPNKTYSEELKESLRSDEWMKHSLLPYIEFEDKIRAEFADPNKKAEWRESSAKTAFTYLLLDPRITNNLPTKARKQTAQKTWVTFVNSIFYVGKGMRARPFAHLQEALTHKKSPPEKKVQKILDIWSEKLGVISLHIFQNVIPAEAYTYEAAMIDVIGVANLNNLKNGIYYGVTASLPLKERRMLGLYFLYKAMQIFLQEGERQLRPEDLSNA